MIKNKLLLTLIIFQGVLIVIGLVVVIYTIFVNLQNDPTKNFKFKDGFLDENVTLLDQEHIQVKKVFSKKIVFEIYNLKNSEKVNTIILNEE